MERCIDGQFANPEKRPVEEIYLHVKKKMDFLTSFDKMRFPIEPGNLVSQGYTNFRKTVISMDDICTYNFTAWTYPNTFPHANR